MTPRRSLRVPVVLLLAVAAAVAVAATLEVGPPTSSARTATQVITAERGIVQSTVTGTGNVEPAVEDTVNFKTGGTLQDVLVQVGQHVNQGQLMATLDPTSAKLALAQAEQNLTAAEDQLTSAKSAAQTASTPTTSTQTTTTPATATPASTTPARGSAAGRSTLAGAGATGRAGAATAARTAVAAAVVTRTITITTPSQATTSSSAASVAQARASVDSAEAALGTAQHQVDDANLYAPASGTVVSLAAVSPGDTISAGGTGNAVAAGSGSSSSSGSGSGSTAGGLGNLGSSSSSSSSGGSSSSFAEIVNSSQLTMTVAFSESDITKVKVGQPATVTLDALAGVELAAHVSAISTIGANSSGVVSYNATITLGQNDSRVRPGMSASVAVITAQAQGVTLPNSAVSGTGSLATVQLVKNGRSAPQQVVVGMRGDSRTQIISGLSAGQQVSVTTTLPTLGQSSSLATGSGSGTIGGGGIGGAGGFSGPGLFGGGGGFAARLLGG